MAMRVGSKGRYAADGDRRCGPCIAVTGRCRWPMSPPARRFHCPTLSSCSPCCGGAGWLSAHVGLAGDTGWPNRRRKSASVEIFEAVDDADGQSNGPAIGQTNDQANGRASTEASGPTAELWSDLQDHIRDFLDNVSVGDVLAGRSSPPSWGPPGRPSQRLTCLAASKWRKDRGMDVQTSRRIYCDYNATAPLRPEAREAMAGCAGRDGEPLLRSCRGTQSPRHRRRRARDGGGQHWRLPG